MIPPEIQPSRWLPTFGFFLFLGIMASVFFTGQSRLLDPGVGRHLRTAEFILETGRVPRADPLSFTHAGEPWTDFEWAFEATLGELYRAGGLPLVVVFTYAIFATTVLGVFRTLLHSGLSLGAVVIGTGVAFLTLHLHFEARPVLFTYLFMALVVEVWTRRGAPLRRDWLLLPVVFVAWANIHAGWAAALVFLVLAMGGRLVDRWRGRLDGDEAPLIPWAGLTLLCAVAVSFNPWGWHLYRQVFLFATSYKSFRLWDEYAPPDFSGPSMSALTVLFLLGVVILARVIRRGVPWRTEQALPVLFFLWEGLKAQRHVLLLAEVAIVPVMRDFDGFFRGSYLGFFRGRMRLFQERQRLAGGDARLAPGVVLLIALLYLHSAPAQRLTVGASVTPGLRDFVLAHPDRFQRPLVTTWNAGPLLWNARPWFRVNFDDRGDFYGDTEVFRLVNLGNGQGDWRAQMDQDRYDSAIVDPFLPLKTRLATAPGWHQVYADEHAVVFWHDPR
jgi:hypothetical protein